jgi:uncharacterized protein YdeI (YjbR/CyaY-like superfamily)
MSRLDDAELVQPKNRATLRRWLSKHHDTSPGVWVVSYTKASGKPRLDYEDIVLELLCFGWVDSTARKIDDERSAIYCAPRKKGGTWAATNKARVKQLAAEGLLTPAGQAVIAQAKRDGSWTILDSVEALQVPDDLAAAFVQHPAASAGYESLSKSAKKQVLWAVISAKRAETRAARVQRIIDRAEAGEPLT